MAERIQSNLGNEKAKGYRGKKIMKRKKKAGLTIVIILAVLGIGIFAGYQMLFNHIDPIEQAVIDDEVGSITDEILDDIKTGEAATGEVQEDPTAVDSGTVEAETESEDSKKPVSEEEKILSLYNAGFLKLQNEGNAIIDRLVAGIKADFAALQAEGAGKADYARLAASYTNRANAYEAGMDSSVDDLLANLEEDLSEAGVSDAKIEASIKEYQQAYEEQKTIRQNKILDKAKAFL